MPDPPSTAALEPVLIVLAAGASRRLGAPKALADLCGSSVLERLLAAAAAAGLQERVVVGGCHHAEIERALQALEADGRPSGRALFHPDWAAGRSGSLARAVGACPNRAILVAPADVPLITARTFEALTAAWYSAGRPPRAWIAPFLCAADPLEVTPSPAGPQNGRRFGHPLLLGPELAARTTSLAPDHPLRSLRDEAEPLLAVGVPDAGILDDLDTPGDLLRLRERLLGSSGN